MAEETKKKRQRRDRRPLKRVRISGPTVYMDDKVVAGDISQEFTLKPISDEALAKVQTECVVFSSKLLSLIAQNGYTAELPLLMVGGKNEPLPSNFAEHIPYANDTELKE